MHESPEQNTRPIGRIALLRPAPLTDERVAHALQLFDSVISASRGTSPMAWIVTSPAVAQVLVVHEDDRDERIAAWKAEGKLVVLIATDSRRRHLEPLRTLVFPFGAAQVLSLLERLAVQLDAAEGVAEQSGPQLPLHQPAQAADPWAFVEALLTLRAVENGEAWLAAMHGRTRVLWLRGDAVAYAADATVVRAIAEGSLRLETLELRKSREPAPEVNRRSGMELSWFAGYHASSQLTPQLRADTRYRMSRWLDFGAMIRPMPAQLRVAAELASQAASLNEVAASGALSPQMAARTFNALYACGVLVESEPAADGRGAPAVSGSGLAKLLASMRKHLGLVAIRP
jgi:hypothetical protein